VKAKFLETVGVLENNVLDKGEEMKKRIDSCVNELLGDMQEVKSKTLKEIETWSDALNLARTALKSFLAYSQEMQTLGKPSDITRVSDSMQNRAAELQEHYAQCGRYTAPQVSLLPFEFDETVGEHNNLIGEIVVQTFPGK